MPQAAPKPCIAPQCRELVRDGTSRCAAHKRDKWQRYRNDVKRVTGRKLQAMRHALFTREPLCRECVRMGHTTLAVIRDHITPLAEGGDDVDDNVQPLCQACSDRKTAGEARRGRGGQMSGGIARETGPQAKFLRAQVLEKNSGGGV